MEKTSDFLLGASIPSVTELFRNLNPVSSGEPLPRCFTQEEELFVRLSEPLLVASIDIHHDVTKITPSAEYVGFIQHLSSELARRLPALFSGLTWFFDPRDTLHPLFIQMLGAKDKRYLYVLRVDLTWRARFCEVLERGSNSRTPKYRTNSLFIESEILPLETLYSSATEKRLHLAKLFQNTWKGESGRRYHVEGQWIDQDITKFVTRAVLSPGRKTFPFYPLRCRFNTLSAACIELDSQGRRKAATILELAWTQLAKRAPEIQSRLQEIPFTEDDHLLLKVREACQPLVEPRLGNYRLEAYLNSHEQKEYLFHG
jgi:hypothetical protein